MSDRGILGPSRILDMNGSPRPSRRNQEPDHFVSLGDSGATPTRKSFRYSQFEKGVPCHALCYAGQDPFWLDRSTLNRVLRIKQLIVQKLTKRENYSAGSLIETLPGLAQRFMSIIAPSTALANLTHGPGFSNDHISAQDRGGYLLVLMICSGGRSSSEPS
jgi:hypothetical protein